MTRVPYIPSSAPFTAEQRAWLNGYLTGLFSDANIGEGSFAAAPVNGLALPAKREPLLVMYGSQTGTAEQLAKRFAKDSEKRGFAPEVLELNDYPKTDLNKHSRLVLITSTWGDGDPPDNAVAFWNHLNSDVAPKLNHLGFCVLGLGDKSYADFCGAGKKFDARLDALGAKRLHPLGECDVDYEAVAKAWMEAVWPALKTVSSKSVISESVISNQSPGSLNTDSLSTGSLVTDSLTTYGRANPFPARLITNRKLNASGSSKDTRHFEFCLDGSRLAYEVGDALGVMPLNCPGLVEEILQALGCDGEEAVRDPQGKETSLRHALLQTYAITQTPLDLLRAVAERTRDTMLNALLDPAKKGELDRWLYGREIIDLLLGYPLVKFSPPEFVALLRKLQPRLYSISSSPKAHPGEVHLTVGAVRYESYGRARRGVCSIFLADRVELNHATVPVFVQASNGFRLPAEGERPIIMIGPGTGIAPFRAFLEERRAVGAQGKNWLFFGDQHQASDFLYREEIEALQEAGALTRLDTAFSRDHAGKIYVQNRMLERSSEFYAWLESGAHVYVCGDAKRMAKDVDATLHQIIQTAGNKTAEQAAAYVQNLKAERRYQRDVY